MSFEGVTPQQGYPWSKGDPPKGAAPILLDPGKISYNAGIPRSARQQVTISSYEDDAIRTRIETGADGVPALA